MLLRRAAGLLLAAFLVPGPAASAQEVDPYLEFLLARRLEEEGDAAGAQAALERAAAADPESAEIRAELAALHLRQNDAGAAEKAAREALARDAGNVEAHRVLGLLFSAYAESAAESGRQSRTSEFVTQAIGHLEKVAATPGGATDINVQYNLGRLHLRNGNAGQAIERLTQVVEQNPYSIQARLSLAQAFAAADRHGEAAETLEPAVEDEPRLASTLAQYYERAGKPKEAADAYARALAANPNDLRALLALGRDQAQAGEYDKAIDTLARAQKLVPNDPGIAAFLAQTYLQAKRYQEAAVFSAAAQTQYPGDLRFTRLHARALFETGAASRALAIMEAAVRAHPDDSGVYLSMADLYTDAGRDADALKLLEDAGKRFPADADVLNFFGYLLAERGERLDESMRLITRALEIDPGNPSYLDSLGWAHFKRGNLAEAEKHLSRAAAGLPRNSVVQDHYGDVLARTGRWTDAIEAWTRALDGDGEDVDAEAIQKKIRDARTKAR